MPFKTESEAIDFIFRSRRRLEAARGLDENTRDIAPTRRLLVQTGLLRSTREYAVVTGSKGKGSTVAITARLLQHLGHRVGMMASPHLVTWYERIRVNGRMIPQADFLRILSDLQPAIEAEEARLTGQQYISPQGIFLLIALTWFDEQEVNAAVLEVGRGGRYDDISLVPNKLSLFTPIIHEHTRYLGDTLERIAWHKAGIIKEGSYAYSLAQAPEVLAVLQREADARDAEFFWFSQLDVGQWVADTPNGVRMRLQRYGECELSLLGHYQIANATLAVQAAGNMHARLPGIPHQSQQYIDAIRAGLADVTWHGRLEKLQDRPAVYVDGAINPLSARALLASMRSRITRPLVTIAGVPEDRDYPAVYAILAEASDALILTETDIHPHIHFPPAETALAAARRHHDDVQHAPNLRQALDRAYEKAGQDGTILLSVAQPLVGEAMLIWQVPVEQI